MARYITNKQVNSNKVNDLEEFKGMGDSIWNFISSVYQAKWDSSVYQAKWDSLYTDNNSTTLRAKISSKFTPRVALNPSKSNKEITKHILVTIKRAPLPPPLLAKSKKEVNVILKYFQSNKTSAEPKKLNRSYISKMQIHLRCSKSRNYFLLLMQRKSTKSITLSRAT